MKRLLILVLGIAILGSLVSCGAGNFSSSSDSPDNTSGSSVSSAASEVSSTPNSASSVASSSTSASASSDASSAAQPSQPSIGGFSLGQTPSELLSMLGARNISLSSNTISDPAASVPKNPVKDGRTYVWLPDGSTGYLYTTKDMTFSFDSSDKECIIQVETPAYATDKGLKVGDTTARMKQLYGTGYKYYDNNVYVYQQGSAYVSIYGEDATVSSDSDDSVIGFISISTSLSSD